MLEHQNPLLSSTLSFSCCYPCPLNPLIQTLYQLTFSPNAPLKNFSSLGLFTCLYFCPSPFSHSQTLCQSSVVYLFSTSLPTSFPFLSDLLLALSLIPAVDAPLVPLVPTRCALFLTPISPSSLCFSILPPHLCHYIPLCLFLNPSLLLFQILPPCALYLSIRYTHTLHEPPV